MALPRVESWVEPVVEQSSGNPVEQKTGEVWFWLIPVPVSARAAANKLSLWAKEVFRGWRWIPAAIASGTIPFLISWQTGIPGHQILSAILLMLICIGLVRDDAWVRGLAAIALMFAAHSVLVIGVARFDPGAGALLPGAEQYWRAQIDWIQTGKDPEHELRNWVPAHAQHLAGTVAFTYTSLGLLTFYRGLIEVDLMNYYNAQLLNHSVNKSLSLAYGWHIWSLLRGIGYVFIAFETISFSLQRLTCRLFAAWKIRRWRWLAGLAFLLADGVVKALLTPAIREQLFSNLK